MDMCLWNVLYDFLLYSYPPILEDEEAFKRVHDLIHTLLLQAKREERQTLFEKIQRATMSKQ